MAKLIGAKHTPSKKEKKTRQTAPKNNKPKKPWIVKDTFYDFKKPIINGLDKLLKKDDWQSSDKVPKCLGLIITITIV